MKRKFGNGGDVLSDILESVGVRNMIHDESDESDESSDIDFEKIVDKNFDLPGRHAHHDWGVVRES